MENSLLARMLIAYLVLGAEYHKFLHIYLIRLICKPQTYVCLKQTGTFHFIHFKSHIMNSNHKQCLCCRRMAGAPCQRREAQTFPTHTNKQPQRGTYLLHLIRNQKQTQQHSQQIYFLATKPNQIIQEKNKKTNKNNPTTTTKQTKTKTKKTTKNLNTCKISRKGTSSNFEVFF